MNTLLHNDILKHLNLQIINKNYKILLDFHSKFSNIYNSINDNEIIFSLYHDFKSIVNIPLKYFSSKIFQNYCKNIKQIYICTFKNIIFYTSELPTQQTMHLMKISITLSIFKFASLSFTLV